MVAHSKKPKSAQRIYRKSKAGGTRGKVNLQPGTAEKLHLIYIARGWSYAEAITRMADTELSRIESEKNLHTTTAPGCSGSHAVSPEPLPHTAQAPAGDKSNAASDDSESA